MEQSRSTTDTLSVVKLFGLHIADQKVTMLVFDQLFVELDRYLKFEGGNILITIQGSTNLTFACTNFRARKMVLRARSWMQTYVNLHCLIYNLLIAINFTYIFYYQLTLKNISQSYAQRKGFSCFN